MQHAFLYINALIIPVIVAALVNVAVLKREKQLGSFYRDLILFLLAMTLASVANLPLFYDAVITNIGLSRVTYGIGWDLIWTVYTYFWFRMAANAVQGDAGRFLSKLSMIFIVSYVTGWIISLFFAQEQYWTIIKLFIYIEIAVEGLFILIIIYDFIKFSRSSEKQYCLITSFLLLVESIIVNLYDGANELLEQMYIMIWLLLAILSILVVRKACRMKDMSESKAINAAPKDEDTILEEMEEEYGFTEREIEIYRLILKGKNNKEICEELYISEATVKTHIHNLLKKLSASSRVDAIIMVKEKIS